MGRIPFIEFMLQVLVNCIEKTEEVDQNALPDSQLIFMQQVWCEGIEYTEVWIRKFRKSILRRSSVNKK